VIDVLDIRSVIARRGERVGSLNYLAGLDGNQDGLIDELDVRAIIARYTQACAPATSE
jgi:hypothetical protein